MELLTKIIEDETDKMAGKQKAISAVPIRIKFFSKNVVDLMLVDLPGITKVFSPNLFNKIIFTLIIYFQNPIGD